MKKVILMTCLVMFMLSFSIAEAKISRTEDSFNGSVVIKSEQNQFVFWKNFSKGTDPVCLLRINMVENQWWLFSDQDIEFKFDNDDTIYKLKVAKTDSEMWSAESLYTTSVAYVPQNILDKFAASKSVIMRIYFTNQNPITWTLLPKTVNEWNKVANSDKDGKPLI